MKAAIESKREIIVRFDNSVHASDLATQHSMVRSTILTFFIKNKAIKAADVVKGV